MPQTNEEQLAALHEQLETVRAEWAASLAMPDPDTPVDWFAYFTRRAELHEAMHGLYEQMWELVPSTSLLWRAVCDARRAHELDAERSRELAAVWAVPAEQGPAVTA
ncbi:hypothetical protein [Saccharothrix lopnurensis]|uniref:Uncharacterized protein n=1 Tax=Saccharothrix lopnurensis TaxID=1670621 RepID=A0ABW1P2X0_9PSEU